MIDINSRRVQLLNERRSLIIPGDYKTTIEYSIKHFIETSNRYVAKKKFFSVALSGGSTPSAIFQMLCSNQFKDQVAWDKILFFWSDERSVLPDNFESNYKMAMDAGIKNMPIKKENVFRMKAEADIEKNADKYEKIINEKLHSKPLDMVMLGMGEDGHTASLFPKTEALKEIKKLVVANYIPQKKTWRMTLTFTAINQSENIIVYVLGKSKKNALKKVLFPEPGSGTYPSQLVGSAKSKALWIVDMDAAAELKKAT